MADFFELCKKKLLYSLSHSSPLRFFSCLLGGCGINYFQQSIKQWFAGISNARARFIKLLDGVQDEIKSKFDMPLSDLLYNKTKQKQNLKTALRLQPSRATASNIWRVTVNCFPFDVIVFAMLPAHGIWRETVSLLDAMWPWTSQGMGAL